MPPQPAANSKKSARKPTLKAGLSAWPPPAPQFCAEPLQARRDKPPTSRGRASRALHESPTSAPRHTTPSEQLQDRSPSTHRLWATTESEAETPSQWPRFRLPPTPATSPAAATQQASTPITRAIVPPGGPGQIPTSMLSILPTALRGGRAQDGVPEPPDQGVGGGMTVPWWNLIWGGRAARSQIEECLLCPALVLSR